MGVGVGIIGNVEYSIIFIQERLDYRCNKTIYLIYNLNNLHLLSLSLIKKNFSHCHVNVIHMRIIAFCIHFSIIACCQYLTCSSVCNYSHILCVLVTQCFVPKHLYNVLLLTCSISYFVFICGFMER
jgi:hypothetical protein